MTSLQYSSLYLEKRDNFRGVKNISVRKFYGTVDGSAEKIGTAAISGKIDEAYKFRIRL
jgi:hypothetical protein